MKQIKKLENLYSLQKGTEKEIVVEKAFEVVELDSLVAIRIMKHCKESLKSRTDVYNELKKKK